MNLYIADLHFGHRNAITFDHRPFQDCDEMDMAMIELWNSRVAPDDNVYVVGDFAHRSEKDEAWYLQKLRGHKHLVIGNNAGACINNYTPALLRELIRNNQVYYEK